MKNKVYLKKYLLFSLVVFFIGSIVLGVLNYFEYKSLKNNYNVKLNNILQHIEKNYPNIEKKDLVNILQAENSSLNSLKEYGYDVLNDSFILTQDKIVFNYSCILIMVFTLIFILLLIIFVLFYKDIDRQIDKIIVLIEKINRKCYEINLDCMSEDKLSILKQELYKTMIMLRENAENSYQDKVNIKNSLQDISHQIKTPLTSINILLDNIINNPNMSEDTRYEFTRQIRKEITNITFLVQSILKLSRFEVNDVEFVKTNVLPFSIVSTAIENVSNLCDLKNINIEVKNNCSKKILCDYNWQIEAITILLKNAVEYSYENSKILIECSDNNVYSMILIKDFGIGMDEDDIVNIFKRFYKGKNSSKDSVGIGLSLAKKIIEQDNGKVSVESKKGVGTSFLVKYFY